MFWGGGGSWLFFFPSCLHHLGHSAVYFPAWCLNSEYLRKHPNTRFFYPPVIILQMMALHCQYTPHSRKFNITSLVKTTK